MTKVELKYTKQIKQITDLANHLEKQGWKIIEAIEQKFQGKPRWEIKDQIPNLVCSWLIQRNPVVEPICLDFIAHWDYMTNRTEINDCSYCEIRTTNIELHFVKDKSLKR